MIEKLSVALALARKPKKSRWQPESSGERTTKDATSETPCWEFEVAAQYYD